MPFLTNVGKIAAPLAAAVFIEPLLNFFAPSVKPLIRQFIRSDEAQQFLKDLVEGAAAVGPGVCTNFLASQADKLLGTLNPGPKLEEALTAALRKALTNMRDDLRRRNQHNILTSFDQFFTDWDENLNQIHADGFLRKELLETKQFAHLFYEWTEAEIESRSWWMSIRSELEAWTSFGKIPSELEAYLKENFLVFANDALTSTLDTEEYKKSWNEFQKTVGTQILSTLGDLESHILDLKDLARVAGGQFISDQRSVEFPLRKLVDSLVEDLSAKKIYIQRETFIVEEKEKRVKISGLQDFTSRDGYFLLAAPAGSGKSTLMARWIREFVSRLQIPGSQTTTKVCYHFYNKQEGTSDHNKALTILTDQLLKAHYIQANVNSFNPATIDSIIPNSLELDHPERLIIVVDGLDEAGEPSTATDFLGLFKRIFPHNLGKNTTAILTVRDDEGANSFQYYRNEFGLPLNTLEIQEVSTGSLASYLSDASDDRLKAKTEDDEFLRQVIAKTEGLAIYVHYLLDELSQADAAQWPEIIATLPKGFEKYVSTSLPAALDGRLQWEDALSFIALTQSALTEEDLIALTEFSGNKLKKVDFDRVRWDIKRWLRSENDLWAFSHQKIGEVFYGLYVESEKSSYTQHLLAYCERWQQHESRYVLQNYAELLGKEQEGEMLYDLASNKTFLNLQRMKLIGNPSSPLRTLQTAMIFAVGEGAPQMIARFSLLHAKTIEELSTESWLDAYSHRGVSGALELADNFGSDRRIVWYLQISRELIAASRMDEAGGVLRKLNELRAVHLSNQLYFAIGAALPVILQGSDFKLIRGIYAKLLPRIEFNGQFADASKYFTRIGDFDKAKECARAIDDRVIRSEALGSIGAALLAINFADAEQLLNEAEDSARSIDDPRPYTQALISLANVFSDVRRIAKAKELLNVAKQSIRKIEDPETLSLALGSLGAALLDTDLAEAEQCFDEAEQVARSVEVMTVRYGCFHRLIGNLAHHQLLDRATRFIDSFAGFWEAANMRTTLSTSLANAGYFLEAEQVASSIADSGLRNQTRSNIVAALTNVRKFDEALIVTRSIRPGRFRVKALTYLASALTQVNRFDESEALLEDAEQVAGTIRKHSGAVEALTDVATVLVDLRQFERAKELFDKATTSARSIMERGARARAMRILTAALAKAGYYSESDQATDHLENPRSRAQALTELALALAQAKRFTEAEELFGEAEQVSRSITETIARSQSLGFIATALARAHFFDKAEQLACSIHDHNYDGPLLRDVAAALASAGFFDESERVARSITSVQFRTAALGNLAAIMVRVNLLDRGKHLSEEAKQAALSISDLVVRSQTLESVATALTDAQLKDEVKRALLINNGWSRFQILKSISIALAKVGAYDESERAANHIENLNLRAQVLIKLASALGEAQRFDDAKRLFVEAERVARSITNSYSRSQVLGSLASALAHAHPLEALRIAEELRGGYLITVLRQLAKGKNVEGLKKYVVSLSYETTSALRGCAQIIQLYDDQADAIYCEIRRYL